MTTEDNTIVVSGDICVDWLKWCSPIKGCSPANDSSLPNWQQQIQIHMTASPGGALLLAKLLKEKSEAKVLAPELDHLESIPPEQMIHSFVELAPHTKTSNPKDKKCYRMSSPQGFAGPEFTLPQTPQVAGDDPNASVVAIYDQGNGFRDQEAAWPKALADGNCPIIVYSMCRPLTQGVLWNTIKNSNLDRTLVILTADDLRAEGINISRHLSWERTVKDLVWHYSNNPKLGELRACKLLIVRLGVDGALFINATEATPTFILYYDQNSDEDGFAANHPGDMIGLDIAFLSELALHAHKEGLSTIGRGIINGILASQHCYFEGFGAEGTKPVFPISYNADEQQRTTIVDTLVPKPSASEVPDPEYWCILKDRNKAGLEDMSIEIVMHGTKAAMYGIPIGKFRFLSTVDRSEIESYRSIRNLMLEYLDTGKTKRPLSIAVFGPPGSGKSFGVTEVAKSLDPGRVKDIEFNVSQFQGQNDLVQSLHKVRDIVLEGKIPLVFFDEFDSEHEGQLGWLKKFLAPMQDGKFKDGESVHPIGKAIFVFAGGTSENFRSFCYGCSDEAVEKEKHARLFRDVKGPDFISRLRGFVNVTGLNPVSENDKLFTVRRAIILRSMIERFAKHLMDGETVNIDPDILRAMLLVPRYKHGTRSMEAVLNMSSLAGRKCFEQAALPLMTQLNLHVDAEPFLRQVMRDTLFSNAKEIIARAIHDVFRKTQKGKKADDDPSMAEWDLLNDDFKHSNIDQAEQIPKKLEAIGCSYRPQTNPPGGISTFSEQEVETLAEMEHARWCEERRRRGWIYGAERNVEKKITNALLPWEDISEELKDLDRKTVENIPPILSLAKFEVYQLKS